MHKEKEKEFLKLTKAHKKYVNSPILSGLNMKQREADTHKLTLNNNRKEAENKCGFFLLFKRKLDVF